MDGHSIGRNVIYKSGVEKEMPLQEIVDILGKDVLVWLCLGRMRQMGAA